MKRFIAGIAENAVIAEIRNFIWSWESRFWRFRAIAAIPAI